MGAGREDREKWVEEYNLSIIRRKNSEALIYNMVRITDNIVSSKFVKRVQ